MYVQVWKSHTSKKNDTQKSDTDVCVPYKTHLKDTQEPYKKKHQFCCTELGDKEVKSHTGIPVLEGVIETTSNAKLNIWPYLK